MTPYSSPVRARYGVSLVRITSDAYFATVIVVPYMQNRVTLDRAIMALDCSLKWDPNNFTVVFLYLRGSISHLFHLLLIFCQFLVQSSYFFVNRFASTVNLQ